VKTFVCTLAAILVAAALIYGLKAIIEQHQRTQKTYRDVTIDVAKGNPWSAALNSYEKRRRRREAPKPEFVTLTKPASPDGQIVLKPGTKLKFVSIEDTTDDVIVVYDGKEIRIPISVTDLE
jgi:outer membrane lipoprotein-sorting protein